MVVVASSVIGARWFYVGRNGKAPRLIVLHSMEVNETSTVAEAVGRSFAIGLRRASAHVGVDNDSTVRYVDDANTAFGAAGANNDGLHLEQAGRAGQFHEDWLDPYSRETIRRAATVAREWAKDYRIPPRRLSVEEVADGTTKGITDHATVSAAFPLVSTGHWDPGPNYPWDIFLADVLGTPAPRPMEDTVALDTGPDGRMHRVVLGTDHGVYHYSGATFAELDAIQPERLGLTENKLQSVDCAWSPDGRYFVVEGQGFGNDRLYRITYDSQPPGAAGHWERAFLEVPGVRLAS